MMLIDSQVHIWGADTPERPWPKRAAPQREVPLGHDELLREMDAADVDRAILVPPSWEGDRNDLALAATRLHPHRFAIMGRLDPDLEGAEAALAQWLETPGMLGLRFLFSRPEMWAPLVDGRMDWVWPAAERAGIPIMMLVPHALMDRVGAVAERHPALQLILDHMGLTTGKDAEAFAQFDRLLALAAHPNVAVKASAIPCFVTDGYPFRSAHEYVRKAYDAFGPKRLFWGTDFSRLPCTYREGITMFTEEMPWFSPEDLEWVMGRGIAEALRWPLEETR
jgi:L-fuconolactonase